MKGAGREKERKNYYFSTLSLAVIHHIFNSWPIGWLACVRRQETDRIREKIETERKSQVFYLQVTELLDPEWIDR